MKMKTVSNLAAACAVAVVLASFILKSLGLVNLPISEAIAVGAFMKGAFIGVDASLVARSARGGGRERNDGDER